MAIQRVVFADRCRIARVVDGAHREQAMTRLLDGRCSGRRVPWERRAGGG
jgi:hypothetical protein